MVARKCDICGSFFDLSNKRFFNSININECELYTSKINENYISCDSHEFAYYDICQDCFKSIINHINHLASKRDITYQKELSI